MKIRYSIKKTGPDPHKTPIIKENRIRALKKLRSDPEQLNNETDYQLCNYQTKYYNCSYLT